MHRIRTLAALLLVLGAPATSMVATDALELRLRDGSLQYVELADSPRITITDKTVGISHLAGTLEFDRSQLMSYSIGDFDLSGVNAVKADFGIETSGLTIRISGLKPGSAARIVALDGRTADSAKAPESGVATLRASGAGIYIVETESSTFKVALK